MAFCSRDFVHGVFTDAASLGEGGAVRDERGLSDSLRVEQGLLALRAAVEGGGGWQAGDRAGGFGGLGRIRFAGRRVVALFESEGGADEPVCQLRREWAFSAGLGGIDRPLRPGAAAPKGRAALQR